MILIYCLVNRLTEYNQSPILRIVERKFIMLFPKIQLTGPDNQKTDTIF